jgi:hypothetical protein
VYKSWRLQGAGKEGIPCAWAIGADGRKILLHMAPGNKELYQNQLYFLRDKATCCGERCFRDIQAHFSFVVFR